MATIVASWEMGRGYGHLSNLAPAARALAEQGHSTVIAARDPGTVAHLPDQPFARILQAPVYTRHGPPSGTLTYGAVVADGGLTDAAATRSLVRSWLDIFERQGAAALLSEHSPVSLLSAHIAGIPAARLGIGFTAPPAVRPFPSLMTWISTAEADRARADFAADEVVRETCRHFGAPVVDGLAALLAGAPPFLATWPELDIYGARRDVRYYGTLGGFGGAARPAWPTGKGRKAFIYLPFRHPLAQSLARTIVKLDWRAIWYGWSVPTSGPANIAFAPDPVDMAYVLPEADVQVGRGGQASVCDGLRAGCPQLLMPDTLESLLLGGLIQHRKFGLRVDDRADADELAAALDRLATDPAIGDAVAGFRARYASYNPVAAAREVGADLIAAWRL